MNFIRRAEIILGPLADWQGGGPIAEAIKIVADGSNENGLRAAFRVRKTITGEPNRINLALTNLSKNTRQSIRQGLTRIQINAGYINDPNGLSTVASGGVLSVVSQKSGPDNTLIISALDGYGGMIRSAYARSFVGGTSVASVVKDVAASMPGVTIGRIDIGKALLYSKGQHFTGAAPALLNRLADQYGFSWSVQDGIFQAIGETSSTGNQFPFQSGANLISVSPVLNGPLEARIGVKIDATFEARIKPGDRAVVASTITPDLNGQYVATAVDMSFDSHGGAGTTIESLRYF